MELLIKEEVKADNLCGPGNGTKFFKMEEVQADNLRVPQLQYGIIYKRSR
jgi:hypothetical protein